MSREMRGARNAYAQYTLWVLYRWKVKDFNGETGVFNGHPAQFRLRSMVPMITPRWKPHPRNSAGEGFRLSDSGESVYVRTF